MAREYVEICDDFYIPELYHKKSLMRQATLLQEKLSELQKIVEKVKKNKKNYRLLENTLYCQAKLDLDCLIVAVEEIGELKDWIDSLDTISNPTLKDAGFLPNKTGDVWRRRDFFVINGNNWMKTPLPCGS